ncbi:MAG: hypothetical protein SWH78_01490 [Thermodesulfobacteriota bacterium]|nr:hypothetical protein [Thermodesulfobacteriota bacterium]
MRILKIFLIFSLSSGLILFAGSNTLLIADQNDAPHQTHLTELRGPELGTNCGACHTATPETYQNASQAACDPCHSRGGVYDGVNDSTVGAIANWENVMSSAGATQSLIYETDGRLKIGKERWCATCHDLDTGGPSARLVDDFEYNPPPDPEEQLRTNWINKKDAKPPFFEYDGGPDGSKHMRVKLNWDRAVEEFGKLVRAFPSPLDVSGTDALVLYVKVDKKTRIRNIKIKLVDQSANVFAGKIRQSDLRDGAWSFVALPFADFGSFDPSVNTIKKILIIINENSGGLNWTANVSFDAMRFVEFWKYAPNVIRDNATSGFYATGHGTILNCTWCHDPSSDHIDDHRLPIFDYIQDTSNPTNFRFYSDDDMGMQLPYNTYDPGPDGAFALCYKCHNEQCITTNDSAANLDTNFKDACGVAVGPENLHLMHVGGPAPGTLDAPVFHGTCVLCHDPHGQSNPAMTRREMGNLIYFDANGCEIAFGSDSDMDNTMDWHDPDVSKGAAQTEGALTYWGSLCAVCHLDPAPPDPECNVNVYANCGSGIDGFYKRQYAPSCVEPVSASHTTHFTDPKGPLLSSTYSASELCNVCHGVSPLKNSCIDCHSPNGAFDGLDDSVIGAWTNWADGVYESDGKTLKVGKENWCLGCHDDDPATTGTNESAIIDSVYAPCIAGDENNGDTYGYNITGHKIVCTNCHDAEKNHIDGEPRTYEVTEGSPPVAVNPYSDSYRLKDVDGQPAMNLPRLTASLNSQSFALCLDCHSATDLFSSGVSGTNFWNADTSPTNSHNIHLKINSNHFDSDWDGTADSRESCIACHNVHGSPSQAMIRHGEMISTPGTTDKVPALNFVYLIPSTGPTATATWAFSVPSGGTFDLYGWWTGGSNRASDAPYTISYGSFSQTIDVDQTIQTGAWNYIGTFTFAGATSGTVVLGDDANGYVIADAIGWDTNGDTTPDIIVDDLAAGFSTQGSGWLTSTSVNSYLNHEHYHAKQVPPSDPNATLAQSVGGFMNYGSSTIASNGVCKACHNGITYVRTPNLSPKVLNAEAAPDTVPNDGSGSTLITASVYDPDGDFDDTLPSKIEVDLSVIGGSSNQAMNDNGNNGDQSIGDGIYSYEATVPASTPDIPKSLVITATDDASNSGQGTAVLTVVTPGAIYVDDLDPEFSTQGTGWLTSGSANSYKNSEHYHAGSGGGATAKATWTFSIPEAGDYELYGWWTGGSNRASDAPYTIYYSGGPTTIDVNQKIQTGDWNYIGGPFTFTASPSSGSVEVSDDANGYVITDAIKWDPYP